MTPKQVDRLRTKISDIRKTLAAERRKFGWYDDSRGLRYLPTRYFVQLQDYKGGLTYLRWFDKNFPDDCGFPDFLFEWTIILFKCGLSRKAAKKAFDTFCSNTYMFDKFFNSSIVPLDKWEGSNVATIAFTGYLAYSSEQAELADFTEWLACLKTSEDFESRCRKYIDIQKRLKTERDQETRHYLIMQARQLQESV